MIQSNWDNAHLFWVQIVNIPIILYWEITTIQKKNVLEENAKYEFWFALGIWEALINVNSGHAMIYNDLVAEWQ